jgi:hypothetical protein
MDGAQDFVFNMVIEFDYHFHSRQHDNPGTPLAMVSWCALEASQVFDYLLSLELEVGRSSPFMLTRL